MKKLAKKVLQNSMTRRIAKVLWPRVSKLVHWWAPLFDHSQAFVSLNSYHFDGTSAAFVYRQFSKNDPDLEDNYVPELFQKAVEFGHVSWPRKFQSQVQGKHVLDLGCGTGLHGVAYIIAGAKSYMGLDPKIDLDSDLCKNRRSGKVEPFGSTPRQIMTQMPRIRLVSGTFEDIAPEETFDLIVLHNVTEHLRNIETVFQGIFERLHADGALLFHHHNFYCWNGHHLPPRSVGQINAGDPKQADVIDWNHLSFEPPDGHYIRTGLNKIRLDELRQLTARYLEISQWDEIRATKSEGGGRLTQDILARHKQYSERELAVKNVLCTAHHKGFLSRH